MGALAVICSSLWELSASLYHTRLWSATAHIENAKCAHAGTAMTPIVKDAVYVSNAPSEAKLELVMQTIISGNSHRGFNHC